MREIVKRRIWKIGTIAFGFELLALGRIFGTGESVDYAREIKPVLQARCYSCHGALKQKAGLRLDSVAGMKRGAADGPVIQTLDPSRSPLLKRVKASDPSERMPPEGEPLTPKQIAALEQWVGSGAPAPAVDEPEKDPREHWAFQKPLRKTPPKMDLESADGRPFVVRNPIDAWVAAEWSRRGLRPRGEAPRAVLLRRVYLDLVGLPPSREALIRFLNDERPDAYERVVDELLDSPNHGERWARHWMDIWRYADWYGRRQVPDVWNSAPQVWRWRDWIVRSLNSDRGYDRMIQEMLAGDEVVSDDPRAADATGYMVRNWYALNPNQWMRETVEHTAKAFLGLTVHCAHCHDHKYDPISQKEYFQFRAFFEAIGLRQDWVQGEADPGPFQKYEYSSLRKIVRVGSIQVFDENPSALTQMYLGGDERNLAPGKPAISPGPIQILGVPFGPIAPVKLPAQVSYPALQGWMRDALLGEKDRAWDDARKRLKDAEAGYEKARADALAALKSGPSVGRDATGEIGGDGGASMYVSVMQAEAELQSARRKEIEARAERELLVAKLDADAAQYFRTSVDPKAAVRQATDRERRMELVRAQHKAAAAEQAIAWLKSEQGVAEARRRAEGLTEAKLKDLRKADEAALQKAVERRDEEKKAVARIEAAISTNAAPYQPLSPTYPRESTGRRKALAEWMTHREHPLTARVGVNHIWARHFRAPLVGSVFDFGRNGAAPTHPELLDWLAVAWMDSGWSMKTLHRLMVTSSVYRMSSGAGEGEELAKDPENRWLWRMRSGSMESEALRDSLLAVAGELSGEIGGPVLLNTEADRTRRRTLYYEVYPEDGGHAEFLRAFDPPDPSDCYRRTQTVLPQQALALVNAGRVDELARLLAGKLWAEAGREGDGSDRVKRHEFITRAFETILNRRPRAEEARVALEFLAQDGGASAVQKVALVKEAAASREAVGGAGGGERARVGLVRALLNHHEFITVR